MLKKFSMNRRSLLVASSAVVTSGFSALSFAKASSIPPDMWSVFKQKFYKDGRIIDTGNGDVSHSEGQGLGLLMSALVGDKQSFEAILSWTTSRLQRKDKLFSWKWEKNKVADTNNATDGDLYISWALIEAAIKWNNVQYAVEALDIANAVLATCVKDCGIYKILLPAQVGFEEKEKWITNPSYYVFPALQKIYQLSKNEAWKQVIQTGLNLSKGWGPQELPADWLSVDKKNQDISFWKERPARFGYEAIRVPLFLMALGFSQHSSVKSCFKWFENKKAPAWVDLQTGAVAEYTAPASFFAVGQACSPSRPLIVLNLKDADYYDAFLSLLVTALIDK